MSKQKEIKPLRKAVIPAAGFGTRMLPAAKAVPKELLPILDRPVIQYVVEEIAAAGIGDVLMITSRHKRAIEDHFDRLPELEDRLLGGKSDLLARLRELMANIKLHSVRQPEPMGLGDAVMQAERHVGDEPFLCLLGDTIFSGVVPPAKQLAEAYAQLGSSVIGLEEVPADRVGRYGIVGGTAIRPDLFRLETLIEKPSVAEAPSRLAIAARYVLTPGVFACLKEIGRGRGGEVQLTDALALLAGVEPVYGLVLESRRHDVGNPVDWLKTNLLFAAEDRRLWEQLLPLVRTLAEKG
ncbi:MAG TPA: UTP--glucose-1-phosphate uridylyltransferase [Tepidisphaeraceae bacterium]|jgi:UTP--glucose-1-phosphate uridylyltransferase|nr:UTP--glucose-1-phosphate uridylyltransferase [Tepidisphaeraceae bacterium]